MVCLLYIVGFEPGISTVKVRLTQAPSLFATLTLSGLVREDETSYRLLYFTSSYRSGD